MGEEQLLTIREAAVRLRVSQSWLYKNLDSIPLPHVRLGRSIRFRSTAVDAFVAGVAPEPVKDSRPTGGRRGRA